MENANHWYFTKEQLENTPSRKCGIEASKELSYRQQAANFIQDMGQRLQVTQLCINTAIVYMHRFYMFHSFIKLHRNSIAVAALFLAAKVEEQPRKLEHVVRIAYKCLHRGEDLDVKSDLFMTKCSDLVLHENIMLQTLGFEIGIDHPHTYVVKLLQLVKASKDLAQTSYFMATNSLHLTTMCLQYKPTVVACVCIHLACKWSNWKIEPCSAGKEWYYYVDKSVTPELLEELTKDFLAVLEKSPNRLKRRVGPENNKDGQSTSSLSKSLPDDALGRFEGLTYDTHLEIKRESSPVPSTSAAAASSSSSSSTKDIEKSASFSEVPATTTAEVVPPHVSPVKKVKIETLHSISLADYREKREKERLSELRPPVPAHLELPLAVPMSAKPAVNADKHHHTVNQEKRPVKPNIASNEVVPHKTNEKLSMKHGIATSHAENISTSRDKVNHQLVKPTIVPSAPPRNALPKTDAAKVSTKAADPFVLLTRVDQQHLTKKNSSIEVKQNIEPAAVSHILKSSAVVDEKPTIESRIKTEYARLMNSCDSKRVAATKIISAAEAHETVPVKHSKHKSASSSLSSSVTSTMHNSHGDFPVVSQVKQEKQEKQTSIWDGAKSNGSGITEPPQPVQDSKHHPSVKDVKTASDKVGEVVHNKHERRDKHEKHKHRHAGKDRTSNHVPAAPPVSDSRMSAGSIKITIPKEKLVLSGMHQESNQKLNASVPKEESPRTPLKIKIAKVKPTPENSPTVGMKSNSGTGLKLVITKDKNAGSYSTSHKAERASRKRQRSPSSKDHNLSSSGKSKVHVTEQVHRSHTDGLGNSALKIDGQNCVPINPAHRSGGDVVAQTNSASLKQTSVDMYHHQNNVASQQFMMQYNTQYYPPYYPYAMPTTNMQYSPMQPPPLPPHMAKAPPPLPREPPPPLPPQPPLPSE